MKFISINEPHQCKNNSCRLHWQPVEDTLETRNSKTLRSFIRYCIAHPEQRFWQALRNWSGFAFIYGSDFRLESTIGGLQDTFYKEDK